MKKIVYYLCAAVMIAFSGCQDDIVDNPVVPAQTGEEIMFGSELTNIGTRTIYGDNPVDGAYPVYWEDGDQVAIYCPQAAQGKLVNYKITPATDNASHSSAVTKVNTDEAGLQWGTEEVHKFYGFYPASAVTGTEDGKIVGEIPTVQDPVKWNKTSNDQGGTTYTGVANTDYAFMWAYGAHNKKDGGDVALIFHPWVTILDIEINGPANDGEKIKMSSVQVRSLNNEVLNGKFICDMNPVEEDPSKAPTYTGLENLASTRNQISIELYDKETKDFITLGHGDKIVVRAYLLPSDDDYDTGGTGADHSQLQIRVAPFNSAVLTRTLNGGSENASGIVAHKINKVVLPSVSKAGPNYWMSSLDPDIFVTELSLPGSKMSYQTNANGASVPYQGQSIAEQFTNGIRAFQIQTASTNTGSFGGATAADHVLYMTVAGNKTGTRFKDIVKEIAEGLKTAEGEGKKNEYAFILLTAALGECDSYRHMNSIIDWETVDGNRAWMDAIRQELSEMTAENDTYRIYTGEITPNTTIADVAGHIIIKVNYNTDAMGNHLSTTDKIPAMFAQWGTLDDVSTDFTETNAYAINTLRWGTSNHSVNSNLQWFYHEATSVGYNNDGGEETYDQKTGNIEDMWNRSIQYYKNSNDHSMWFLNDLGGCYVNGGRYSSGESKEGVNAWTQVVGPYATNLLQNRNEDATLGIVLMNYANPDDEYTGNLIQTIINNNFNFQLRKKSATTTNYNATYSNGGNAVGWDK